MSYSQVSKPSGQMCQQDITLVAGTVVTTLGSATQRFTPSCSKIVGVVGKTLGGVGAFQNVTVALTGVGSIANSLASVTSITAFSSLNTDTSVYTVYWVNEVAPGLSAC